MGEFFGGLARGLRQGAALGMQKRQFDARQEMQRMEQEFKQQQMMIQERQADLQTWESMLKLMDPSVPKGFQKLGLKQMLPQLGIDPKSPQAKEVIDAIGTLNPDEVQGLREALSLFVEDAQPGEVQELAKQILMGNVSVSDVMTGLQQKAKQGLEQEKFGLEQERFGFEQQQHQDEFGLKERQFEAEQQREQALLQALGIGDEAGQPEDPGAAAQREAEVMSQFGPGGRAAANIRQQTDPALVQRREEAKAQAEVAVNERAPFRGATAAAVGLNGFDMNKAQAFRMGVFADQLEGDRQEVLKEIAEVEGLTGRMTKLREKISGRPELLGVAGSVVRNVNSFFATIQGLTNLVPGTSRLNISFDGIKDHPTIRGMMDRNLSGEAAEVQSQIIGLAYELATANKTGRLNERDIERSLTQLGQSANPDAFTDVLSMLEDQIRSDATNKLETTTGFPSIRLLPPDDLNALADDPTTFLDNQELLEEDIEIINEAVNRELRRRLRR